MKGVSTSLITISRLLYMDLDIRNKGMYDRY